MVGLVGSAVDPRVALVERLFGPEPNRPLPGYWYCLHADCEGLSRCEYEDQRFWRPER